MLKIILYFFFKVKNQLLYGWIPPFILLYIHIVREVRKRLVLGYPLAFWWYRVLCNNNKSSYYTPMHSHSNMMETIGLCHIYPGIIISTKWCSLLPAYELHALYDSKIFSCIVTTRLFKKFVHQGSGVALPRSSSP